MLEDTDPVGDAGTLLLVTSCDDVVIFTGMYNDFLSSYVVGVTWVVVVVFFITCCRATGLVGSTGVGCGAAGAFGAATAVVGAVFTETPFDSVKERERVKRVSLQIHK